MSPAPAVDLIQPYLFLRCHGGGSKKWSNLNPKDNDTPIWGSVAEPGNTGVVATCGGNIICFIDCHTGVVVKRLEQPNQEFYCMAWSKLGGSNVLAASGPSLKVFLICPSLQLCYSTFLAAKAVQSITALVFHPINANWLFCGTSGGKVQLFAVSSPNDKVKDASLLCSFVIGDHSLVTSLLVYENDVLVASSDSGIYTWSIRKTYSKKQTMITKGTICLTGKQSKTAVDGIVRLSEKSPLFAAKLSEKKSIYIFNGGHLKSVGKVRSVKPVSILNCPSGPEKYILLSATKGILTCGGSNGQILVHDLRLSSENSIFKSPPTCLSNWPESFELDHDGLVLSDDIVINQTCISSDLRHVVAVTNNNLVCIYKTNF